MPHFVLSDYNQPSKPKDFPGEKRFESDEDLQKTATAFDELTTPTEW